MTRTHTRRLFQSTLPTRGSDSYRFTARRAHFSISIHAPHEGERRRGTCYNRLRMAHFNPRSPRGGATFFILHPVPFIHISIHAPHEGERRQPRFGRRFRDVISIHAPHEGERLERGGWKTDTTIFQSTLPTRGSDARPSTMATISWTISIHAPHEGERP